MSPILLGGDQLTAARARAAQHCMTSELTAAKRLQGLLPVIEDWHTKQALLVVSYVTFKLKITILPLLHIYHI